jgi:oligo-1,6-glucosidase
MSDVLDNLSKKARDHSRTPMQVSNSLLFAYRNIGSSTCQWDASSHAGFTTGTPWMRVNDDYADSWNTSVQAKDEASVLNFWKRALAIRKKHEVLVSPVLHHFTAKTQDDTQVYGDFRIISFDDQQVFAYTRTLGNTTALVLLNFKETEITFPLDEVKRFDGFKFVLGNHPSEKELPSDSVILKGYEGKVYIT